MAYHLSFKSAAVLIFGLGVILLVPPLVSGDYLTAGGMFVRCGIASVVILGIATWDEWQLAKKNKT